MIYTTCVYYSTVLYFIKYFFFFFGHAALPLARLFLAPNIGANNFWHALARLSLARVGTSLFDTPDIWHVPNGAI